MLRSHWRYNVINSKLVVTCSQH